MQQINTKFSGGLFDTILQGINTAAPLALGYLQQQQQQPKAGCLQGQLTDDGPIAGCIDQIIAQYHQIADNPNAPLQDVLTAAQAVNEALNSNQYFGKVTPYLTDARAVMANAIRVLQQRIGGGGTQTVVTTNAQGQLVTTTIPIQNQTGLANNELINGVPNIYLLGAGGLLALIFVMRK